MNVICVRAPRRSRRISRSCHHTSADRRRVRGGFLGGKAARLATIASGRFAIAAPCGEDALQTISVALEAAANAGQRFHHQMPRPTTMLLSRLALSQSAFRWPL